MEFFQERGLGVFDVVLLAAIFIAWPLAGELGRSKKSDDGAPPFEPLDVYNSSMIMLWATAIPTLIWWAVANRPWADLGFQVENDLAMKAALLVAAGVALFLLVQLIRSTFSERMRAKLRTEIEKAGDAKYLIPRNAKEYRRCMATALTAGFTEEVVFRGYLIWALTQLSNIWVAVLVAIAHFVFLHRYQGWRGMKQVAMITTLLTGLFILSGSLIPGILLHIAVDVINITRLKISMYAKEDAQD